MVEKLEEEVASRDKKYEQLEARVKLLTTSDDVSRLMEALKDKDRHVSDLEAGLAEQLQQIEAIGLERDRLRKLAADGSPPSRDSVDGTDVDTSDAPIQGTPLADELAAADSAGTDPAERASELEELRERHAKTLAELDEISSLYHAALQQIAKLAGEIEDAKQEQSEREDLVSPPATPLMRASASADDVRVRSSPATTPSRISSRRRGSGSRTLSLVTDGALVAPEKGFYGGRGHTNIGQRCAKPRGDFS